MPRKEDFQLGELAVKRGWATLAQIVDGLSTLQRAEEQGATADFAQLLLQRGVLSESQIEALQSEGGLVLRLHRAFGPFEVIARIGQGPLGRAYHARDTRVGSEVCLRVLAPRLSENRDYVRRLRDALADASLLVHPALVQIHDFGDADGRFYVSQELVSGHPLDERVRRHGKLRPPEALRAIRSAAEGLALAGERRWRIPADPRPSNFILVEPDVVKLADVGWVKEWRPSPYHAPEVRDGSTADPRALTYSLGASLYFLLTAQPPCAGNEESQQNPAPPCPLVSERNQDVPVGLARYIQEMMNPRPEERPESLKHVALLLHAFENPCAVDERPGTSGADGPTPELTVQSIQGQAVGLPDDDDGSASLEELRSAETTETRRVEIPGNAPLAQQAAQEDSGRIPSDATPGMLPSSVWAEVVIDDQETVLIGEETRKEIAQVVEESRQKEESPTEALDGMERTTTTAAAVQQKGCGGTEGKGGKAEG